MDILVVASTVPAHTGDAVPRFVLDQALSLAQARPDVRIRILAPHTPASRGLQWPRKESPDGRVTQHRFPYAPRRLETLTARGIMPAIRANRAMTFVVPLLFWGERRALKHEVRRSRPDVIYAHWFTPQAIVASAVASRATIPFGFTTHASDVEVWRRLGPLGTRIVRRVTRRARFITAVSRQTAERLLKFFAPGEREQLAPAVAIIPMGVHPPNASAQPGDPRTVLIMARLVEKKGIDRVLNVWPTVYDQVPGARLLIGGDGPMRAQLERQAQRLRGVEFHGYVTGEAKAALEHQAGVVAVPSIRAADGDVDGLPVSAIEGLARGAYVVATDASGAQDILNDTTAGIITSAHNDQELADALIAAMTRDPQTCARDSEAARDIARSLEWPVLAHPTMRELERTDGWFVQGSRS